MERLIGQPFDGGEDNLGPLAVALGALEGEPRATLLWVHGPQGHAFGDHTAEIEQMLDRSRRLPELWMLPVEPGPNRLLRDPRLFAGAHTLAWSGDPRIDIGAAIEDYFDTAPRWTIARTEGTAAGLVTGSTHVEKLWATRTGPRAAPGGAGKIDLLRGNLPSAPTPGSGRGNRARPAPGADPRR